MIEDGIDTGAHFLLGEEVDEFEVAVPDRVHEGVPVVGSDELVDEVREGVEEADDRFGIARF